MCYGNMADIWNKNKEIDPLTHKLLEEITKEQSRNVQDVGEKWNLPWLAAEAQYNKEHPDEGMAKVSTGAGAWFAGMGLGQWLGGGQGGVNVGSGVSAAPGPGVVAPGMQKAAMIDSLLINSGVNPAEYAGLLRYPAEGASASRGMTGAQRFALNQGINMMQPDPPPQYRPPPQQPPQQQEPVPPIYGGMSEEERKRRLREQGYNIY